MTYPVTTKNMSFGEALRALKRGVRVCRAGWNGKGMWLYLVAADRYALGSIAESVMPGWATIEGARYDLLPWIGMKTADNKFVPWLASQTDILAEDWEIVT